MTVHFGASVGGGAASEEEALRQIAAGHRYDNHGPGDPGYCDPDKASWSVQDMSPAQLSNVFASMEAAAAWLGQEILMDEDEGLGRGWARLVTEEILEYSVILVRDEKAYVWDGWHRSAAAIATGRSLKCIVGRPR